MGILSQCVCWLLLLLIGHIGAALEVVEPQLLRSATPSDLAILLHSLAAFGYRPSRSWFRIHGQAVRKHLSRLGVRRVSNLLWAHAKLGMRPADEGLLQDMVQLLHGRMQEANTRDLASSLWALATLGHAPPKAFLVAFGAQVRGPARGVGVFGFSSLVKPCWG